MLANSELTPETLEASAGPLRGLELTLKATDMGNQYAPLSAARAFLKGDDWVAANPVRALGLLEHSARCGFEGTYLDFAKGHRDGTFGSGKDLGKACLNASLADRFKAEDAGVLRTEIGLNLKPEVRKKVGRDVDLFVERAGK